MKKEIKYWIILLIPFIFVILKWDAFPDEVAIHYNIEGEADNWAKKEIGLFIGPVMNVGIYLLLLLLPLIDPRKMNYSLFEKKYSAIRLIVHLFLLFVFSITTFDALGYEINTAQWIQIGILALFMILGNYMGAVKPNYFVGVRTPWTLENETVWKKTHNLTAKLWVGLSAILLVIQLFFFIKWVLIPYIVIITVIPLTYSYIIYKKLQKQ